MPRVAVLAIAMLAACGDNVLPFEVWVAGTPQVVAYRAGDAGSWHTAPFQESLGSRSGYWLPVVGDYAVIVACTDGVNRSVFELVATTDDPEPNISFSGFTCGQTPSPIPVPITGQMQQPGFVFVAGTYAGNSTGAPWTYEASVDPGFGDIVAISEDRNRLAVRSDVALTGRAVAEPIDLTTEGKAMAAADVSITNAQDPGTWTTAFEVWLTTPLDTTQVAADGSLQTTWTDFPIVPASILGNGIYQQIDVLQFAVPPPFSSYAQVSATMNVYAGDVPSSVSLDVPPPLDNITLAPGAVASWDTLPLKVSEAGYPTLDIYLTGCGPIDETLEISSSWLAHHTRNQAAFDAYTAGFDPFWLVDITGEYRFDFLVSYYDNPSSSVELIRQSYLDQFFNFGPGCSSLRPVPTPGPRMPRLSHGEPRIRRAD